MSIMKVDGHQKQGLDFLADLWAGRVHLTLAEIYKQLENIQQGNNIMTENERKIVDAASVIVETTGTLTREMNSLKDKIVTLTAQAQAPEAHDVEDLSDEFQSLNQAVSGLQALAENLNAGVQQEDDPGDVGGSQTPPAHPADPEPPGATVGQPAVDPTPVPPKSAPPETDPITPAPPAPVEDTGPGTDEGTGGDSTVTDPTPVAESGTGEVTNTSEDSGDLE